MHVCNFVSPSIAWLCLRVDYSAYCNTMRVFSRQLSRHLVGLWTAGHPVSQALLKRMLVSCMFSIPLRYPCDMFVILVPFKVK